MLLCALDLRKRPGGVALQWPNTNPAFAPRQSLITQMLLLLLLESIL